MSLLKFEKKCFKQIVGKVMFGKATVTLSDVTAGNGVVHAIDEVLFASPQTSQSIKNDGNKKDNLAGPKRKNLVELCKDLGFTSFAAAITYLIFSKDLNVKIKIWTAPRLIRFCLGNNTFDGKTVCEPSLSTSSYVIWMKLHIMKC